ncbi:hypothetical protein F4212_13955 [Candidatus Poribacteria bacterium]|nr:hypothetical protein [Candidatus Poribacteria bacterium]
MNPTISKFRNAKAKQSESVEFLQVIEIIRSDTLSEETKTCLNLVNNRNGKVYKEYKETKLPAVTFASELTTRDKEISLEDRVRSYSGLVCLDFDNIDTADALSEVSGMPETVLAFISPSGRGVKVVVSVNPIPTNDTEYKASYSACVEAYSYIGEIDRSGSDVTRLCFLCQHQNAFVNTEPSGVNWELYEYEESTHIPDKQTTGSRPGNVDLTALKYLHADDYDVWLRVGMACHYHNLDVSVWEQWSQQSSKYEIGVCQDKWKTFTKDKLNPVTWGWVVYTAKCYGYTTQQKRKSTKQSTQQDTTLDNPFFSGKKFLPMAMESYLIREDKRYISLPLEKGLRLYHNGIYVKEKDLPKREQLITQIKQALGGELFKHSHYKEVENMLLESTTPITECEPSGLLCVENGILNLDTLALTPHTPDQIFFTKIPVSFDKDNAKCPQILKWLNQVLDGDDAQVSLFFECVGYTLLQTSELQKIIILEGTTKTGKSTAAKLLQALFGRDNVSNVSLHALDNEDNRFSRVKLHGKIANISTDMSQKQLKGDGYVKAIVAGDPIEAEHKGVDLFTFTPKATLWAMTNKIPRSYDKTSAWYERLLIIRFDKQFLPNTDTPPDTNILAKIATPNELSGLLTISLILGKQAVERGYFSTTEKQKQAVLEVMTNNDTTYLFVDTLNTTQYVWDDTEFYNMYIEWADSEGIDRPMSKTKLAESTELHGIVRRKLGNREKREWKWVKGINN